MVAKKTTGLLALLVCLAIFAGCTGTPSTPAPNQEAPSQTAAAASTQGTDATAEPQSRYPIAGNHKLTLAIGEETQVTANAATLGHTPFAQALMAATGVNVEYIHPAGTDAFNLLFASGEYPDIITYDFGSYRGGAVKAIKDQIIYPLDDLLDEYAPALKAVLEENDLYRKSMTTSDGHIAGFPFIRGDEILLTSHGLMIRQDWLDDLGLEVPVTPDDLYNVLEAFKTQKGATVPYSTDNWSMNMVLGEGLISSPFNLPKAEFYQLDGKVHYGYAEPAFKDVLGYLNKLYANGLLDPNYTTLDGNTKNANIMNGSSGVTNGPPGGGMGNYLQTMEEKDPKYNLTGFGPLVAAKGDIPMSTHYDNPVSGFISVITVSSANKEVAAQFLDYAYTQEGKMLFNFGIENESFTMVDGVPTYTDLILKNPDGLTMQLALAQYTRAWARDSFVQDRQYILQYMARPQQKAALEQWSNSNAVKYKIPPTTVAEADSAEYSKLMGDISTYIGEMKTKFITGIEPLDKFETEYLPTLEKLGINRVIQMQQAALDEFNAR